MTTGTVFRVAFWALLAGMWVMRVYFMRRARPAGRRRGLDRQAAGREGRGLFIFRTAVLLFLMAASVLYAYDSPWLRVVSASVPDWLRWAGLALGLVSLGLLTWAQAVLGKEWSPQLQLHEGHRLVTSGPYAWVRHPMYTAMSGAGIALALLAANWCFVLAAAAMVVGFVLRAPREERMMLEAFGEQYSTYMRETGRFFPKLRVLLARRAAQCRAAQHEEHTNGQV